MKHSPALGFIYSTPALANHCFIRTTLAHFYILLHITTLYYTRQSTHRTTFIEHSLLQFDQSLDRVVNVSDSQRTGILAYHGMEWNTRTHFTLHHFNPSIQSRALYISAWLHLYHYPPMGSVRTAATAGHHHHQQHPNPPFAPPHPSIPLSISLI